MSFIVHHTYWHLRALNKLTVRSVKSLCNRDCSISHKGYLAKMTNILKKTFSQATPKVERSDWIVIGISGVTCGGKTTLANRLLKALTPAFIYHQDKYFYPDDSPHHVICEGLAHNNYDILSSLDMARMYDDVIKTMDCDGKAHATSTSREPGRREVPGKKFLILEGFTVLNYKPLLDLCNLSYYFVLEYSECVARRVHRVYDPPDIEGYFDQCVWPEHIKYRAEIENDSRVKLMDAMQQDAFDVVMTDLKALGAMEIQV